MAFPDRIVFGFTLPIYGLPEDAHGKAYDGNADGWARELAEAGLVRPSRGSGTGCATGCARRRCR